MKNFFNIILFMFVILGLFGTNAFSSGIDDSIAGFEAEKRGENEVAIKMYTKAINSGDIDDEPKSILYYSRGLLYLKGEQPEKAIVDFTEAFKLDQSNISALNLRAAAYFKIQNYSAALKDLNQVIMKYPADAKAYGSRSVIHEKLGNKEMANRDANKAKELNNKAQTTEPSRKSSKATETTQTPTNIKDIEKKLSKSLEALRLSENCWRLVKNSQPSSINANKRNNVVVDESYCGGLKYYTTTLTTPEKFDEFVLELLLHNIVKVTLIETGDKPEHLDITKGNSIVLSSKEKKDHLDAFFLVEKAKTNTKYFIVFHPIDSSINSNIYVTAYFSSSAKAFWPELKQSINKK
jgi:tetratricopeptide (TPR) repeat protein